LDDAIGRSVAHLDQILRSVSKDLAQPAAEIIQTHVHLLRDPGLRQSAADTIRSELCNAEWALQLYLEKVLEDFRLLDDEYIKARSEDVRQVVHLVQSKLASAGPDQPLAAVPDRLAETLVVATELTPGEMAVLHHRGVAGVVTEHGSRYSHAAIMADGLGIPAVFGVRLAHELLAEGEALVLDGNLGIVYASPHESVLQHYEHIRRESRQFRRSLSEIRELPPVSTDGQRIVLRANAEREDDLASAVRAGADGVGLFRTEFLHAHQALDEEGQVARYVEAVRALGGLPLTIRTLDLGADKSPEPGGFSSPHLANNPALGLRAVRLCLRDVDQFRLQLRAILRASAHGPVRCLIPMLTNVKEVEMVRALLDQARKDLEASGIDFDPDMPLGGMIEVPAAALAIGEIGADLDFLSVGTNDLLQYALAADRVDEDVAHLYDPQHPGVVRLLHQVFQIARRLDVPVAVCGELAGDTRYTRLLLALGLREFSMHPGHILEVKQVIRDTDVARATAALTEWLNHSSGPGTPPPRAGGRLRHAGRRNATPRATSLLQAIDLSQ
jgi:phosphotransferase system enzyme I (PtsI)